MKSGKKGNLNLYKLLFTAVIAVGSQTWAANLSAEASFRNITFSVIDLDTADNIAAGFSFKSGFRGHEHSTSVNDNLGELLYRQGIFQEYSLSKFAGSTELSSSLSTSETQALSFATSVKAAAAPTTGLQYNMIQSSTGRTPWVSPLLDSGALYIFPNTRFTVSFEMYAKVTPATTNVGQSLALASLQFLIGGESFSANACQGRIDYNAQNFDSCESMGFSTNTELLQPFSATISTGSNGKYEFYFQFNTTSYVTTLSAVPEAATFVMYTFGVIVVMGAVFAKTRSHGRKTQANDA